MNSFSELDVGCFKAFWIASSCLNFTETAQKAGMTQSGVSQHIMRLESQLGTTLFVRTNKKVLLTEAGQVLRNYVEQYWDSVSVLKEKVTNEQQSLSGVVSYAMPGSCLMSPHFGILLDARKKEMPDVELSITICHSEQVVERLLQGESHFGFVTKELDVSGVELIPFCMEDYVLIANSKTKIEQISPESLIRERFIAYPGIEVLFSAWRRFHFPKTRKLKWSDCKVVGEMNDLRGVILMVEKGMGVTVLPLHCVDGKLKSKQLYCYGSKTHASNQIYIAKLKDSVFPRRVEAVLNVFMKMAH